MPGLPGISYMSQLPWLNQELWFPDLEQALEDPNGLLAAGGDLSPERLLLAYRSGIFPWYDESQPILWWSPNPRSVLFPEKLHVSRSLRKTLKRNIFDITFDQSFREVMLACADSRMDTEGTWITNNMLSSYTELHRMGFAHSVEVWQNDQLVGGLYGIALGRVFFGESMFSRVTDASKVGFVHLVKYLINHGFKLIDCQVESAHLNSLGAELIDRTAFRTQLRQLINDNGLLL